MCIRGNQEKVWDSLELWARVEVLSIRQHKRIFIDIEELSVTQDLTLQHGHLELVLKHCWNGSLDLGHNKYGK